MYVVHLAKEPFKFSSSHFTVMGPGDVERLHGHNYQVRVSLDVPDVDPDLGLAFDFNVVKPLARRICDSWDERVLLPGRSRHVDVAQVEGQTEVRCCSRFYSLPTSDVLVLPVVNVTTEELARHFADRLIETLAAVPGWTAVRVEVEETRGQSVSFTRPRPAGVA